jgi:hypothetical protein
LAYSLCGARLDGAPYDGPGFTKKQGKPGLLTAFNAVNMQAAISSLTDARNGKPVVATRTGAGRLLDALKARHAPIASMLCSDAGMKLMHLDARIMLAAVDRLIAQGISCIPVHDNIVVPQQHEGAAREALHLGWSSPKCPDNPLFYREKNVQKSYNMAARSWGPLRLPRSILVWVGGPPSLMRLGVTWASGWQRESAAPALRLEKLDLVGLVGRKAFPGGAETFRAVPPIAAKAARLLVAHRDHGIDRPCPMIGGRAGAMLYPDRAKLDFLALAFPDHAIALQVRVDAAQVKVDQSPFSFFSQEIDNGLIRHNFSVCSIGDKVMSRGPQSFKQSDLTKALKAAEKAGLKVQHAELRRDGSILLDFDRRDTNDNEWDEGAK